MILKKAPKKPSLKMPMAQRHRCNAHKVVFEPKVIEIVSVGSPLTSNFFGADLCTDIRLGKSDNISMLLLSYAHREKCFNERYARIRPRRSKNDTILSLLNSTNVRRRTVGSLL